MNAYANKCSATDPQVYGWSGILVWLTCAGPAPMLGFPLHRGQASGMQCDILVWLTCAGPAPMLGFPVHRGQASGMHWRRVFRNRSATRWVGR